MNKLMKIAFLLDDLKNINEITRDDYMLVKEQTEDIIDSFCIVILMVESEFKR